jgi:hypothetical protein
LSHSFGRIAWVIGGFLAALVVSLFVLALSDSLIGPELVGFSVRKTPDRPPPTFKEIQQFSERMEQLWWLILLTIIAAPLVIPVIGVAIGEVRKIRSLAYYSIGGAIAVSLEPLLVRFSESYSDVIITRSRPLLATTAELALAGLAGGLVYWLIAGRRQPGR